MSEKIFNKTLIIGLGLIGGSFAKTLRHHKISAEIYAFDLNPDALEQAIKSKIIDDFIELENDLSTFDFIVLATPLSSYNKIAKEIAPKISAQTIIIDLGSVKDLEIKNKILPQNLRPNFIPCHPIAGSEKTGFENSSVELFLDKKFIICPENCEKNALEKVKNLIKKIGSKTEEINAKEHDKIFALVSHLPQFLSFLTKEFSPKKITDEFFKNTFRLDNSDAEIWGDIFKINEENLEEFYLEFFDNLEKNIEAIEKNKELPHFANSDSSALTISSKKFFEENFAAIFFRAIIVASYLEIAEIKTFRNYAGSGFRDFTSIVTIFNYDAENLAKLIQKNRAAILKLFNSLS